MKIYRFAYDVRRMGTITGMFVVNPQGEDKLRRSIGRTVYFGEALGKHSEIYGPLREDHLYAIPASEEDVAVVVRVFDLDLSCGYATIIGRCPLSYLKDDGEE